MLLILVVMSAVSVVVVHTLVRRKLFFSEGHIATVPFVQGRLDTWTKDIFSDKHH